MISITDLQTLFIEHKTSELSGRYIHNYHIEPLFDSFKKLAKFVTIGFSANKKPIYAVKVGTGKKRILMWSQMHGNESTTTKAVFDLLKTLKNSKDSKIQTILSNCTICIVPILNPDGAEAYTRVNANEIDLNRDAQDLTQPESVVLKELFESFKPDFCFNLHGQRTIFSAGNSSNSATISFLAPAQDKACTLTTNRKRAMELIVAMNTVLQQQIPNQVGIYDDAFNLNCVGDTFQRHNVPTVLFEAGHYKNDYLREKTRDYIYQSLIMAILYISEKEVDGANYKPYFDIPENKKLLFDIIIKNAKIDGKIVDVAIQYNEVLKEEAINFVPTVKKVGNLRKYFAHRLVDAKNTAVLDKNKQLKVGNEIDFVTINNELLSLKL